MGGGCVFGLGGGVGARQRKGDEPEGDEGMSQVSI